MQRSDRPRGIFLTDEQKREYPEAKWTLAVLALAGAVVAVGTYRAHAHAHAKEADELTRQADVHRLVEQLEHRTAMLRVRL